jgi:hypothetical protein
MRLRYVGCGSGSSGRPVLPMIPAMASAVSLALMLLVAGDVAAAPGPHLAPGPPPAARIVHGAPTSAHPAVAAVLVGDPGAPTVCSGVLVGCSTVVTAARCVCAAGKAPCQGVDAPDPTSVHVYLDAAGLFDVDAVLVHPDYAPPAADVAVLQLAWPVESVPPVALADVTVGAGTTLTAVGYGSDGVSDATGILRTTTLTAGACAPPLDAASAVCWTYTGAEGSTCTGDAGGALLLADGTLAGIVDAGTKSSCQPSDARWGAAVAAYADWIAAAAADDLGATCGDAPALGDDGTTVAAFDGTLSRDAPDAVVSFDVPDGAGTLRLGLHGGGDSRFDIDLLAQAGDVPTADTADCVDDAAGPWAYCEISYPTPGTWYVDAHRVGGSGTWQLFAATLPDPYGGGGDGELCGDGVVEPGEDCDGDVTGACIAGCDPDFCTCIPCADGSLAIDDVQLARHLVLHGRVADADGMLDGFDPRANDLTITITDAHGGRAEVVVPAGDPGWRPAASKTGRGVYRWSGRAGGLRRVVLRDRTRKTGGWTLVVDGRNVPGTATLSTDGLTVVLRSDWVCALKRF